MPVFSPPYGGFDVSTISVLEELDFRLLTALAHDDAVTLPQASSVIDLFEWSPQREKSLERLADEWPRCAKTDPIVIVLHPRFMTP